MLDKGILSRHLDIKQSPQRRVRFRLKHALSQQPDWKDHAALLLDLLRDSSQQRLIVVVGCEAVNTRLGKARISHFRGGQKIVEDVMEQRKVLTSNCLMRCKQDAIDLSRSVKPIHRRASKIPCSQAVCDRKSVSSWICSSCQSIVEYGYVDNHLYCDCGLRGHDQWEFKCEDPKHGA